MDNIENKKKKKKFLPARLNLLFMVVFILFTILIIRLGFVQIVNGEYFRTQSEMTTNIEASVQTERGKMFDRNGEVVVTNMPSFALTYIRIQGTTAEEHLKYAEKIAALIEMPTNKITKRDWQDYWILKQGKTSAGGFRAYEMKLSEKELNSKELEDDKKYKRVRDRITEEDLRPLKEDKKEEEILAVKRELDSATNLDVTFVKKGLSEKEMAVIGEHLGELDGRFSIASTATRAYPKGNEFFFGSIKSIPADQLDHYLLKGYARNNLVGTSYLEAQYEGLLSGQDKTYTFTTTKDGKPIGAPEVSMGSRGHDLVLSIDMNLQKKVGKILEEKILEARGNGEGPINSAYVVMMEPHSGEVLSMVGRELENGKFTDDSYATLQKAFEMGSTVKGATVLAMHQMGGTPVINDQPIKLDSLRDFSSYTNNRIGVVNDKQALEQSSNVFMGIGIGQYAGLRFSNNGGYYSLSGPAGQKFKDTFNKLRGTYSSLGLGVKTGIDLPEEALGYEGRVPENTGVLLYYTIGQYDTYTPIQMAQYASTIANGGYRVQPHLLKEVRNSTGTEEQGPLVSEFETNVINRIDNTEEEINRVKEGFYMVTHGSRGTARSVLKNTMVAGKTGTAQRQHGPGAYNLTFIGYAPYDNPEIAFSVVVPNVNSGMINSKIVKEIVEAYNEGYTPEDSGTEK